MTSLGALAKLLESKSADIADRANRAAIEVGLAVLKELIFVTPVDTSQALSNWEVGLDSLPNNFRGPFVPGTRGSTRQASAGIAYSNGAALIKAKKPGQPLYVSNVTPYISELDRGTARRAPVNFRERARIVGIRALRGKGGESR